jgi:hypothetical protein
MVERAGSILQENESLDVSPQLIPSVEMTANLANTDKRNV